MTTQKWIRARNENQVKARENAILDAAGVVFKEMDYESVTMAIIAEKAGFTRSNLYRYFKTREEIFLTLFIKDVDSFVDEVGKTFVCEYSIEVFVDEWTELLLLQKRLLELSPILSSSLEKNASAETFRHVKVHLHERISAMVPVLQRALPALTMEQVFAFILTHQALVAGGWPMAQYSAMQLTVLDELALPGIKIDFAHFYKSVIHTYLKGLIGAC